MTSRNNQFQQIPNQRREGAPSSSGPWDYESVPQRVYQRPPQSVPSNQRVPGGEVPFRGPDAQPHRTLPTPAPPMTHGRANPSSTWERTQGVGPQRHPHQVWQPPNPVVPGVPPTPLLKPQQVSSGFDTLSSDFRGAMPQLAQGGPGNRDTPQTYSGHNRTNTQGMNNTHQYIQPTDTKYVQESVDLTGFIHDKGRWATKTGGSADVWKCVLRRAGDNTRGEQVAVKSIRLPVTDPSEHNRIIHRFRGQIQMWAKLPPHKHILPICGMADNFGPLPSLVLPWAENGTLTSYLRSQVEPPSFDRRIALICQVASGLAYLHDQGICHGNLTGSNVLINRNQDALVGDFGLSSLLMEFDCTTYFSSYKPSAVRWIDPALIIALAKPQGNNDKVSIKAGLIHDIYSMGCIILQILTGVVPYHDKHDIVVSAMKLNSEDPKISTTFPPLYSNLIKRCWDKNHYVRPTASNIIATVKP